MDYLGADQFYNQTIFQYATEEYILKTIQLFEEWQEGGNYGYNPESGRHEGYPWLNNEEDKIYRKLKQQINKYLRPFNQEQRHLIYQYWIQRLKAKEPEVKQMVEVGENKSLEILRNFTNTLFENIKTTADLKLMIEKIEEWRKYNEDIFFQTGYVSDGFITNEQDDLIRPVYDNIHQFFIQNAVDQSARDGIYLSWGVYLDRRLRELRSIEAKEDEANQIDIYDSLGPAPMDTRDDEIIPSSFREYYEQAKLQLQSLLFNSAAYDSTYELLLNVIGQVPENYTTHLLPYTYAILRQQETQLKELHDQEIRRIHTLVTQRFYGLLRQLYDFQLSNHQYNNRWNELTKQNDELRRQLNSIRSEPTNNDYVAQIERLSKELEDEAAKCNERIGKQRQNIEQVTKEREECKAELQKLKRQTTDNDSKEQDEIRDLTQRLSDCSDTNVELTRQVVDLRTQLSSLTEEKEVRFVDFRPLRRVRVDQELLNKSFLLLYQLMLLTANYPSTQSVLPLGTICYFNNENKKWFVGRDPPCEDQDEIVFYQLKRCVFITIVTDRYPQTFIKETRHNGDITFFQPSLPVQNYFYLELRLDERIPPDNTLADNIRLWNDIGFDWTDNLTCNVRYENQRITLQNFDDNAYSLYSLFHPIPFDPRVNPLTSEQAIETAMRIYNLRWDELFSYIPHGFNNWVFQTFAPQSIFGLFRQLMSNVYREIHYQIPKTMIHAVPQIILKTASSWGEIMVPEFTLDDVQEFGRSRGATNLTSFSKVVKINEHCPRDGSLEVLVRK